MKYSTPLFSLCLLLPVSIHAQEALDTDRPIPNAAMLYKAHCTNCHGVNMEGAQYTPLRKENWIYGRDRKRMLRTVMYGIPNTDMIAWSKALTQKECEMLVDYIIESQNSPPTEIRPFPKKLETKDYVVKVEPLVTEGFNSQPWGIEFVDKRRALITELRGALRWMVDGELDPIPIEGIPVPIQYRESGLTDLALHPDYSNNGWVYLSYVHTLGDPNDREMPAMTRIVRGKVDGHRWVDQEEIFSVPDELHVPVGSRWGCRFLFDNDGFLYFSIGDTNQNDDVQLLSKPSGKLYRILPDGSIPPDNPYVGQEGAIEQIFSIGHRNIQGIAQHPASGEIWATEHGPMGGDELNLIERGKNYGWPEITYGIEYDGSIISNLTHKEGMEQPKKYWTPSPALCPLEFYSGDLFPKWRNNALLGSLVFEEIKRIVIRGNEAVSEEAILKNLGRVRDLKTGPDGALYVVLNNPNAILRLTPLDE